MDQENLLIQRIIAVAGIALWVIFPIAMFISVLRQEKEAHVPHHFKDTLNEYAEPKIDDVDHKNVSLSPGPDHKHTEV